MAGESTDALPPLPRIFIFFFFTSVQCQCHTHTHSYALSPKTSTPRVCLRRQSVSLSLYFPWKKKEKNGHTQHNTHPRDHDGAEAIDFNTMKQNPATDRERNDLVKILQERDDGRLRDLERRRGAEAAQAVVLKLREDGRLREHQEIAADLFKCEISACDEKQYNMSSMNVWSDDIVCLCKASSSLFRLLLPIKWARPLGTHPDFCCSPQIRNEFAHVRYPSLLSSLSHSRPSHRARITLKSL